MKKLLLAFIPFMMLCACSGEKTTPEEEVRNYGKYFVEKLAANQLDSLKASYPDIAKADSIVPVLSDTILVVETSPGQYDVTLTEGITMKVNRSEDGNITVSESKGLFAFLADKVDIAKKTGMWDDKLSDAQLNERMKDEDFFKHMEKKNRILTKNILKISKPKYPDEFNFSMAGYQTITNTSDYNILGKDYAIIRKNWRFAVGSDSYSRFDREQGIDIPAHSSVKLKTIMTPISGSEISGVRWNISDEEFSKRFNTNTGKEYQEYLNSKK